MNPKAKTRHQYCEANETLYPLPEPVFHLQCHDSCPDGTYADVDLTEKKLVCRECQANTYSIGDGGIHIDGTMGAFGWSGEDGNKMPFEIETSCQVHGNSFKSFEKNEDCTPWSRTGSSLKAQESFAADAIVDFDLSYPVYFEKLGEVSFKYKKESVGTKEYKNGVFTFSMDGKTYLTEDDQKTNEVWETYTLHEISPGMHTFSWRYRKLNNEHTEFLEAEIEVSSSSKTKSNQIKDVTSFNYR